MKIRKKFGHQFTYDVILRPAELDGNEVLRIAEIKKEIKKLFIFESIKKKYGVDILKAKHMKDVYTFVISRSLPI